MNKERCKCPDMDEAEIEKLEEKHPVQQMPTDGTDIVSEKEVEAAVREINPDKNSLDWRG